MKHAFKILSFVILLVSKSAFSQLDYSKNIEQVHLAALKMEWNVFEKHLELEKETNPSNLYIEYFKSYQAFIKSYFFANEKHYKHFIKHSESSLKQLEALNTDEAYTLASNLALYRSFVFFLWDEKFAYAKSLLACKSYLEQIEGESTEALKAQSLFELVGYAVPPEYNGVSSWFGIDGDAQKSIELIEQYLQLEDINLAQKTEAQIYQLYIYHFLGLETPKANNFINSPALLYIDLKTSTRSALYKIELIDSFDGKYLSLFTLLKAQYLLQLQDAQGLRLMNQFIEDQDNTTFKTFAALEKARYYLAENKIEEFNQLKDEILSKDNIDFVPDQHALHKIKKLDSHPMLLKSRQLFDAGEYKTAKSILLSIDKASLITVDQKAEFIYRLARIHEKTGNSQKAIHLYNKVIDTSLSHLYFVPYSAYCKGKILAKEGRTEEAIKAFELVGKLNKGEYQNSIELKTRFAMQLLIE